MSTPPGLPWVVVDGRGPVPESLTALLRRLGAARVDGGAYAADAVEASLTDGPSGPDLVVLTGTGPPPIGAGASWQAHGIPHLALSCDDRAATLGPLVLPGRTSCLMCHDLLRADLDPLWPRRRPHVPGPAAVVDAGPRLGPLVATLAALLVTGWLDGSAPMPGVSVEVALPWPTVLHRHWPAHPACRCGAVHTTTTVEPSGPRGGGHDRMAG